MRNPVFILLTMLFTLWLAIPGASFAQETGTLPLLPPGEEHPPLRQRGLNEIESLPTREAPCPVCGFTVAVPLADTLMRRPAGREGAPPKWRPHAQWRDSDMCPYPGPGKAAFQADITVCPACGYACEADEWDRPVSPEAARWVLASLRPAMREVQRNLLGKRAAEMGDDEIAAFFNRQEEIPDVVRTEHHRTYLAAIHAPPLKRAEASWRAAWAARRETVRPPESRAFARHAARLETELNKAKRDRPGLAGDIDALRAILRKGRQGRTDLPGAENMAGRVMLAGLLVRTGFSGDAEALLRDVYGECQERFLRQDQDPLWPETSSRASRTHRLGELEALRRDAGNEILARIGLVQSERDLLLAAAQCIREAFRVHALDGKPEQALFYAYLTGEFLRRADSLPLAAEWLKTVLRFAPDGSPLAAAAQRQLNLVGEEAGDTVNLLSALGQDGDLFEELRDICAGGGH